MKTDRIEAEKQRVIGQIGLYRDMLKMQIESVVAFWVLKHYLSSDKFFYIYREHSSFWDPVYSSLSESFVVGLERVASADTARNQNLKLISIIESVENSCRSQNFKVDSVLFMYLKDLVDEFNDYYKENWKNLRDQKIAHLQKKIKPEDQKNIEQKKDLKCLSGRLANLVYVVRALESCIQGTPPDDLQNIQQIHEAIEECKAKKNQVRSGVSFLYDDIQRAVVEDTVNLIERMIEASDK